MAQTASRGARRHAMVVLCAIGGLAILRAAKVDLFVATPLFLLALVGAAFAGGTAYRLWGDAQRGWRVDARIVAHVAPIAVLTYLTGWGSALVPLQLIAVAGNVKHGGYGTLSRVLIWTSATTLLLETGVHLAVIPSTLSTATGHGIAALGAAAVAFVGSEFAHADRARNAAQEAERRLREEAAEQHEQQRWLEDELAWQAQHDAVTRLPTRAGMLGALSARTGHLTMLYIGVDGLVPLDSTHSAGTRDAVLGTLSGRLHAATAQHGGLVARIGFDEFAVALMQTAGSAPDQALAARIARDIAAALRPPVPTPSGHVHLTANVGIAVAEAGTSAEDVLHDAAIALHAARSLGVERIEVFDRAAHADVVDRMALAADIRGAVVNQDFDIDYQPVIDLRTGAIVSSEALVRWDHPVRGRLGPDRFIPEAERSGHIAQIGRYVLEEAAWQARSWQREFGDGAPTVAVNVSARQLDEHLLGIVEEVLDDTMLKPERLTLELTETAMAPGGAERLRAALHQLKELGITLALDDFGTGYASLEYLQRLPFDVVKIDRTFVRDAASRRAPVARAMVDLARAMGLTTVIEGIETPEERDHFALLGCDRAQGYLFAPPLPAVLLTHQLRRPAPVTA